MIQKIPSPLPEHVRVIFKLPSCVWADRVYLSGEFNQWDAKSTPLQQERDGSWQATLDLPAGKIYEFYYLVDGHWQTDYQADGFANHATLSQNCIVKTVLSNTGAQLDNSTTQEEQSFRSWLPRLVSTPVTPSLKAMPV